MTMASPILKKHKAEQANDNNDEVVGKTNSMIKQEEPKEEEESNREEQEMALVALIEHRTREVEHLKHRISYYTTQVLCFSILIHKTFVYFKFCF